eukprot:4005180-Alexandrium_andersonii.AAC.1
MSELEDSEREMEVPTPDASEVERAAAAGLSPWAEAELASLHQVVEDNRLRRELEEADQAFRDRELAAELERQEEEVAEATASLCESD